MRRPKINRYVYPVEARRRDGRTAGNSRHYSRPSSRRLRTPIRLVSAQNCSLRIDPDFTSQRLDTATVHSTVLYCTSSLLFSLPFTRSKQQAAASLLLSQHFPQLSKLLRTAKVAVASLPYYNTTLCHTLPSY